MDALYARTLGLPVSAAHHAEEDAQHACWYRLEERWPYTQIRVEAKMLGSVQLDYLRGSLLCTGKVTLEDSESCKWTEPCAA